MRRRDGLRDESRPRSGAARSTALRAAPQPAGWVTVTWVIGRSPNLAACSATRPNTAANMASTDRSWPDSSTVPSSTQRLGCGSNPAGLAAASWRASRPTSIRPVGSAQTADGSSGDPSNSSGRGGRSSTAITATVDDVPKSMPSRAAHRSRRYGNGSDRGHRAADRTSSTTASHRVIRGAIGRSWTARFRAASAGSGQRTARSGTGAAALRSQSAISAQLKRLMAPPPVFTGGGNPPGPYRPSDQFRTASRERPTRSAIVSRVTQSRDATRIGRSPTASIWRTADSTTSYGSPGRSTAKVRGVPAGAGNGGQLALGGVAVEDNQYGCHGTQTVGARA